MKILLDARFITPDKTGVGYYTFNLLDALVKLDNLDIHILYHDPFEIDLPETCLHYVRTAFDAHPKGDIYRNFHLPDFLRKYHFDLIHFPAFYSIQRRISIPQVVTIHDLAIYDHPDSFPLKFRLYLKTMIYSSCRIADRILTSSQFTLNRLLNVYPVISEKVNVVPFGVDDSFFKRRSQNFQYIKEKYLLDGPFIISVATLEPRKNLIRLLDAYAVYRRRSYQPLPLILVGKRGKKSRQILERLEDKDLDHSVRWLGYISDEDLCFLYQSAKFMVFPSLYEGFGLPVLEAMASGCPVIASDTTSIPEVVGDAGILIDPESPLQIADAMMLLDSNEEFRLRLKRKGIERARRFTWKHTAQMTMETYFETLETRRKMIHDGSS